MADGGVAAGGEAPIVVHARPTYGLVIRSRLRLFARSRLPLVLLATGVVCPVALSLVWARIEGEPWCASSGSVLVIVGPVFAFLGVLLNVFGGLFHPESRRFMRTGGTFRFDPDGMYARSEVAESRVKWAACTGALELPEAFVLHVGAAQWILPRRDLAAGDADRLRALLRERLGAGAKLSG